MKIDKIECKYGGETNTSLKGKIKEIIVSNHGCEYKITSDFKGLKIEKINNDNLRLFPESKNSVIIS